MDFTFSTEELLIQQMAREFAEQNLRPAIRRIEKENRVPDEILAGLSELDLFGMNIPEQYGGAGAGYLSYVLAMEQIARVHCGPGIILSAHNLGLGAIANFGTDEQKERFLPKAASGEHITSFAFTEPETGSDPKQLTTTAVRRGDEFILNGTKRFISNAAYPGALIVFAIETESGVPTAFIVDKFCPGYSVSQPWEKLGWHGGDLVDIFLKDVVVPVDNVLGKIGDGYPILQFGIAYGKIGMNSLALGTTLAAFELAVQYANGKTHRGQPIAKFQAIQLKVAEIAGLYESSRWLCYRLGFLANDPKSYRDFAREAALSKVVVARNAQEAARISLDVHGSYGLMHDAEIARVYRDAAMGPQVEGVQHMQQVILAGDILKKS